MNMKKSITLLWNGLVICSLLLPACYHGNGLSPAGKDAAGSTGISGTITLIGTPPDSTLMIRPVVSTIYPDSIRDADSLYTFIVNAVLSGSIILGDTLETNKAQIDYSINLKPGYYEWVLVAWFPDIPDYYYGVKELGAYYKSSGELPESVYIPPGEILTGIDITADFANIGRPLPFFKGSN